MPVVEYESKKIEYQIIKSNRKTITISISPAKNIIVKTPKYLSDKEIQLLVRKKANWIINKLEEMPDGLIKQEERKYVNGDKFLYRGKEYELKIVKDSKINKSKIEIKQDNIIIETNPVKQQVISSLLETWYKERARELVYERIEYYNNFVNREIANVRIKNQRKRWGSCSSLGNLNFNWRMIMMPDEMFDYIIVHEMCHLKFLNHSKAYWKCVEEILPNYKERENWIKRNSSRLQL